MRRCCVIDCKNPGIHIIPKNPEIRKQWEIALRREGFKATENSRLCSDHFTDDDYVKEGFYTGLKVKRKVLKKGVIPTQFSWSKEESIKDEENRRSVEKHITYDKDSEDTFAELTICTSSVEVGADINCSSDSSDVEITDVTMKVNEITASSSTSRDLPGFKTTSTREVGSQKNYQFFSIETLMENSKAIKFYTGLESYEKFLFIFSTLCPEVHSIKYRWSQVLLLSMEDQFLLTLIKLRRNKVDFELSFLFDISETTVANVFVTWINFMHEMWNSKEGYLESLISEEFEEDSTTSSIKDCTEAPVPRPTNPAAQQDLLNSNKNQSTNNLNFGATLNDRSQCSETHDVSSSDSLKYIQDILAKKNTVKKPAFLKVKPQTKALFRFLQEPKSKKYLNCMNKINYVCQRLYNFNQGQCLCNYHGKLCRYLCISKKGHEGCQ